MTIACPIMVILKGPPEGQVFAENILSRDPGSVLCGRYESSSRMTLNRVKTAVSSRCSPIVVTDVAEQARLNQYAKIAGNAGYHVLEIDANLR